MKRKQFLLLTTIFLTSSCSKEQQDPPGCDSDIAKRHIGSIIAKETGKYFVPWELPVCINTKLFPDSEKYIDAEGYEDDVFRPVSKGADCTKYVWKDRLDLYEKEIKLPKDMYDLAKKIKEPFLNAAEKIESRDEFNSFVRTFMLNETGLTEEECLSRDDCKWKWEDPNNYVIVTKNVTSDYINDYEGKKSILDAHMKSKDNWRISNDLTSSFKHYDVTSEKLSNNGEKISCRIVAQAMHGSNELNYIRLSKTYQIDLDIYKKDEKGDQKLGYAIKQISD